MFFRSIPLSEQLPSKTVPIAFQGVSLLEILLVFVLLSVISVPFVLGVSQSMTNTKGAFIQSSRSILMNSQMDEMDPIRPTYTSLFTDASMNTSLSDSGQVIPYMRKVTAASSNAIERVSVFYLYNNATDTATSAVHKTTLKQSSDSFRIRIGNTASLLDTSGRVWAGDANTYDGTNKIPGYVAGSSGTASSSVVDIVNTNGNDDALYQYYREGAGSTQVNYNIDLPSGSYTVNLHFVELSATVTGSAPNRRLMDLYLEGILYNNAPYSPYETTGGTYRANVQSFDVTVSDGTLNVSIRRNSNSNLDARISAIEIKERRL